MVKYNRTGMIMSFKGFLEHLKRYVYSGNRTVYGSEGDYITVKPANGAVRGSVLFSFLKLDPFKEINLHRWHSNEWECVEMIRLLADMGYELDVIDFRNWKFQPKKNYDVLLDIDINLQLYASLFENCVKIMHLTGSYPRYNNNAELVRVEDLEKRRKCVYSPKRLVHYLELFDRSLRYCDVCTLIGNSQTLCTFPREVQYKIHPVTVTATEPKYLKHSGEYVPVEREFIWFFGLGAVHKGLDLVLEVFADNPGFKLNVVGYLNLEPDFFKIYTRELTQLPNIEYHGPLNPAGADFKEIVRRCFCFLGPSCSEGTSPAVATMLQVGLYPIISRDTGIDLPEGCGVYLRELSHREIFEKIIEVYNKSADELAMEIEQMQSIALRRYSRKQFSQEMRSFFSSLLG